MPGLCFVTVCGSQEDREFVLGSVEQHALWGNVFILDVAPDSMTWPRLPLGVAVRRQDWYGSGSWQTFRFIEALNDALTYAQQLFQPQYVIQVDADEFMSADVVPIAHRAIGRNVALSFHQKHWLPDGTCRSFGKSEWHIRAWPAGAGWFTFNTAWQSHPKYNGNPHHHAIASVNVPVEEVEGAVHHHAHYAIGQKMLDVETAVTAIDGWPNGELVANPPPWPEKLAAWRDHGRLPSTTFRY